MSRSQSSDLTKNLQKSALYCTYKKKNHTEIISFSIKFVSYKSLLFFSQKPQPLHNSNAQSQAFEWQCKSV